MFTFVLATFLATENMIFLSKLFLNDCILSSIIISLLSVTLVQMKTRRIGDLMELCCNLTDRRPWRRPWLEGVGHARSGFGGKNHLFDG